VWLPIICQSKCGTRQVLYGTLTIYTALAFQPVPAQQHQEQKRSYWRVRGEWYRFPVAFIFRTRQLGFLPSVGFTDNTASLFQVWITGTRKNAL
jgi:hypothetical protein